MKTGDNLQSIKVNKEITTEVRNCSVEDNELSLFERRLWDLTYSCLYKFHSPVIFHVQGPDVPRKIDQYITFFVPSNNDNDHLVVDYLNKELDSDRRISKTITSDNIISSNGEMYLFGTHVEILEFSGIDFYLEHQDIKEMASGVIESIKKKLNE